MWHSGAVTKRLPRSSLLIDPFCPSYMYHTLLLSPRLSRYVAELTTALRDMDKMPDNDNQGNAASFSVATEQRSAARTPRRTSKPNDSGNTAPTASMRGGRIALDGAENQENLNVQAASSSSTQAMPNINAYAAGLLSRPPRAEIVLPPRAPTPRAAYAAPAPAPAPLAMQVSSFIYRYILCECC